MKRKLISLCLVLIVSIGLSFSAGCDSKSIKTNTNGGSTVSASEVVSATDSKVVIAAVEKLFNDANIDNNITEFDSETLYVGLPYHLNDTDKLVDLFSQMTTSQKNSARYQMGWVGLSDTISGLDKTVSKATKDSKYKHIVCHMYDSKDTSKTYLLYKDGVLVTDMFGIE